MKARRSIFIELLINVRSRRYLRESLHVPDRAGRRASPEPNLGASAVVAGAWQV